MAANWMRRTLMVAACASAALLAACGSSTTESAITPQRFIAFGDAMNDVGQNGSRYTVNDGSVNNWTLQVVANYGKSLTPVSAGGLSYATGNARVSAKPDAAGNASTRTVTEQIDAFLASGSFAATDVVMVSGGISDVIAGMAAVNAGTLTQDAMVAAARKAGEDLAAQVRRLVSVSSFTTPSTWHVETDRGDTTFVLKGEEDIRRLGSRSKLMIASEEGIHFLVPDVAALDKPSRKLLERFL